MKRTVLFLVLALLCSPARGQDPAGASVRVTITHNSRSKPRRSFVRIPQRRSSVRIPQACPT